MKRPELWGPLKARYETPGPRKMLALDGGGIRGVLTLSILKAIETQVGKRLVRLLRLHRRHEHGRHHRRRSRKRHVGRRPDRLLSPDRDRDVPANAFSRAAQQPLQGRPTAAEAAGGVRRDADLKPENLKTLLLVVTRNVTTDSPWPISSNPEARYNVPERDDCNLCIPLWQLVRASTAAPIFFPPEVIRVRSDRREPSVRVRRRRRHARTTTPRSCSSASRPIRRTG